MDVRVGNEATVPPPANLIRQEQALLDEFEEAWQGDSPIGLAEFLTTRTAASGSRSISPDTHWSLIGMDLEHRWRMAARQGRSECGSPDFSTCPRLEDYR